jgi:predicted RNA binding protein YcfA (HicA-like mRNA interferase family)
MKPDRAAAQLRDWLAGKATNVRYNELSAVLHCLGWQEVSGTGKDGSHRSWWHGNCRSIVSVVNKGSGQLLPVYVKRAARAALSILEGTHPGE